MKVRTQNNATHIIKKRLQRMTKTYT